MMLFTKRCLRGLFAVLSLALLAFSAPVFAVTSLQVVVTDGQRNELPGETVSLFTEGGEQIESDEKRGAVTYFNDLLPGAYIVKSGGQTVSTVNISAADTVKRISVISPLMPSAGFGLSVGLRGLYKRVTYETALKSRFGNSSGDARVSGPGGAVDLFLRPPNLPGLFFMAGFGYMPSVDGIGAKGKLHPSAGGRSSAGGRCDPYEGCPPGMSASARSAKYDSHVKLTEEYYIRMLIGLTILRQANWQVDAMAGLQGTRTEVTLVTDESGGGGKSESFTRSRFQVGPAAGLQARYSFGPAANTSVYAGVMATLMRDARVEGTSGLGHTYHGDAKGGVQIEAFLGVMFDLF